MVEPLAVMDCEIIRVKTLVDGSPRFELGAGEDANQYLSVLASVQAGNRLIKVIIYDYSDWEKMSAESTKVTG